ncbi:hypothetical protein BJX70DRAFT_30552 [Aspergillus crustosus]
MPNLSTLPHELFLHILYYVLNGRPDKAIFFYSRVPADLCLVNRHWHEIITPLLYSRYEYTGKCDQVYSLCRLIESLVQNPELAAHVRHLILTAQYKPADLAENGSLLRRNPAIATLLEQYIDQAGLSSVGNPVDELLRGDLRALIALLLLHTPRLLSLQLHVYEDDPYLDAILARAVVRGDEDGDTQSRPLQSLQTLYVASAEQTPPRDGLDPEVTDPARMSQHRPFLRLPRLQELHIIDAEIDSNLDTLQPEVTEMTQLSITFMSHIPNLLPVLQYTTNLTQLSLSLNVLNHKLDLSVHQSLWEALLPLGKRLQYLDIYEPEASVLSRADLSSNKPLFPSYTHISFCCPLAQFPKLRQLCITPFMLQGHQCEHPSPEKFISHLPPRLESLTLYAQNCTRILQSINQLDKELLSILQNKPPLPLNCLLFGTSRPLPVVLGPTATEQINRLCEAKGIMFKTSPYRYWFEGGRKTHFARTTHEVGESSEDLQASLGYQGYREVIPRGLTVHGYRGRLDENWEKSLRETVILL